MNVIKTFIIFMGLTVTSLMADYTTIITKTTPSMNGGTEIFFGTVADYSKYVSEISKSVTQRGTLGAIDGMSNGAQALARGFAKEGMKSFGAGAAIGMVVGLLDPYVMSLYADQEYVLIRADKNGELEAIMFIGDKHPSLSEKQIHNILNKE